MKVLEAGDVVVVSISGIEYVVLPSGVYRASSFERAKSAWQTVGLAAGAATSALALFFWGPIAALAAGIGAGVTAAYLYSTYLLTKLDETKTPTEETIREIIKELEKYAEQTQF